MGGCPGHRPGPDRRLPQNADAGGLAARHRGHELRFQRWGGGSVSGGPAGGNRACWWTGPVSRLFGVRAGIRCRRRSPPICRRRSCSERVGDDFDPARTVVVSGGPVAAGFVLVDVLTGQSYTRPVGSAAPAPTTAATPAPAPTSTSTAAPAPATSGPECAFDSKQSDGAPVTRAWVESSSRRCPDLRRDDREMASLRELDRGVEWHGLPG